MSQPAVNITPILRVDSSGVTHGDDLLAAEEPLEIRLIYGPKDDRKQKSISVTMRTPGNDHELATGFLFTEGIINSAAQIDRAFSFSCNEEKDNTITLALEEDMVVDLQKLERHFYTTSSCGVCGKSSVNAVRTIASSTANIPDNLRVASRALHQLPDMLRKQQDIFESTGGIHASALFSPEGDLLLLREDIGRHNALDKLVGKALNDQLLPLDDHVLLLSGRASFELLQKAAAAGIKIVASVGAPSSLAVQLAYEFDITLIGFLRNERFNIYSGMQRVII